MLSRNRAETTVLPWLPFLRRKLMRKFEIPKLRSITEVISRNFRCSWSAYSSFTNSFYFHSAKAGKKLPAVPESLLKKSKKKDEDARRSLRSIIKSKKLMAEKRKEYFKRAEKYAREYKFLDRDLVRLNRVAKKANNFYVPPQPKLAFVIRTRG